MTHRFLNRIHILVVSAALCLPLVGSAQGSSSGSGQSPQAQRVPLSGRVQGGGSVSAQQTASGSTMTPKQLEMIATHIADFSLAYLQAEPFETPAQSAKTVQKESPRKRT
jgi:hypothetical protein